ncbi:MAG: HEAT repeat domain-containing protein, partial [Planctomycetota bacterium]
MDERQAAARGIAKAAGVDYDGNAGVLLLIEAGAERDAAQTRRSFEEDLARLLEEERPVPADLVDYLARPKPLHRLVEVLRLRATEDPDLVPLMERVLHDERAPVRRLAAALLGIMGPTAKSAVPSLAGLLDGGDGEDCEAATWALAGIGPAAAEAVPALRKMLAGKDRSARWSALIAIGHMGGAAKPAVPAVVALMQSGDADMRGHAADALGEMGEYAVAGVPALVNALEDKDLNVRLSAVDALKMIGPPADAAVPALIQMLNDRDDRYRDSAAEALGGIGAGAAEAVPSLIKALQDEEVRDSAIMALGSIGPPARAAVPSLLDALRSLEDIWVNEVVMVLCRIGAPDESIVAALVERLKTEVDAGPGAVAAVLARFGPKAAVAVPILVDALEDGRAGAEAARALGEIGRKAEDAVPSLERAARDGGEELRAAAIRALGKIRGGAGGSIAKTAGRKKSIPELLAELKNEDRRIRAQATKYAIRARSRLRASDRRSEVVRALAGCLDDRAPEVRSGAAGAIGYLGGHEEVPRLVKMLDDDDADVRASAARALRWALAPSAFAVPPRGGTSKREGRPESGLAVTALVKAVTDASPRVRENAILTLGSLEVVSEEAFRGVAGALDDDTGFVRDAAVWALSNIHRGIDSLVPRKGRKPWGPTEKAIGELVARLKDRSAREQAYYALVRIGAGASPAVPALCELLGDRDSRVKKAALGILGSIGPDAAPAVPHLRKMLAGSKRAAKVLEDIGGPGLEALMEVAEGDADHQARLNALKGLEGAT